MIVIIGISSVVILTFLALKLIINSMEKNAEKEIDRLNKEMEKKEEKRKKALEYNEEISKHFDILEDSSWWFDTYKKFLDLIQEPYEIKNIYADDVFPIGYDESNWHKLLVVNKGRGEIIKESLEKWLDEESKRENLKKSIEIDKVLEKAREAYKKEE